MAAIEDLTLYGEDEAQRRRQLAESQMGAINQYATDYGTRQADYRNQLAGRLADLAQQNYQRQNPFIIEDLASRGYATSPTEMARAQTQAMTDLQRENQATLLGYEREDLGNQETLRQLGLGTGIQGGQDALEAALEMRRMGISRDYELSDAARQEALANSLARQQSRNNLIESLIGGGSNILSSLIGPKALGSLGSAAPAVAGATPMTAGVGLGGSLGTAGVGGYGVPATTTAGAGGLFPALGGMAALGGAGLGAMALSKAGQNAGGTAGGLLANPIGYQLNLAKKAVTEPGKVLSNAGKSVSKTVKKIFCFHPDTMIQMLDGGATLPIKMIRLGDETKGGIVESIRISKILDNGMYCYGGVQVTGMHAVKENGEWKRVCDAEKATKTEYDGVVYSIVTDKHRVFSNGIEFGDEHETDSYEYMDIDESLDFLNKGLVEVGHAN